MVQDDKDELFGLQPAFRRAVESALATLETDNELVSVVYPLEVAAAPPESHDLNGVAKRSLIVLADALVESAIAHQVNSRIRTSGRHQAEQK